MEYAAITFEISGLEIKISVEVHTIYKTGVEVEAMHGAAVTALTMYDMLKPIDKQIEIQRIRLESKSGRKVGYQEFVEPPQRSIAYNLRGVQNSRYFAPAKEGFVAFCLKGMSINDSLTPLKILLPHITSQMKKLALVFTALSLSLFSIAQSDTLTPVGAAVPQPKPAKRDWSKLNMANRANDHFMIQLGYDKWAGQPDSIKTKGLSRSLNVYFMLDFPFKTDPRFSIGLGVGVSGSSIFFDKQTVGVAGSTTRLWLAETLRIPTISKNTSWRRPMRKFRLNSGTLPIRKQRKSWKLA